LARVALGQRQDETAHGFLVEVRTHADAAKDEARMARLRIGLAEILLREGENESALDMAAEALELDASPWDWVAARTILARAHQERGDVSAALAHARAGREEAREAIAQAPLPPEDDPEEMLEHLARVFASAASPAEEERARDESRALLRARSERIPDEATRFSFNRRPGMRRALYEALSQKTPAAPVLKDS
jgi:tetratricopeptide (TPR) repeat protein